jgi:hypothetical protein
VVVIAYRFAGYVSGPRGYDRARPVLVLSLLAAMAGGKAGERYHRKIDRFAVAD